MDLKIVHTTGFTYGSGAMASYNQARMTPQTQPGQIVSHSRINVTPTPWTYDYRDYFGNEVTTFEVLDPHESMTVTATCTVHTSRQPGPPPRLTWDDLSTDEVADRWTEYLELTPLVAPPADLRAAVAEIRADSDRPGDAAWAVCDLVHREVTYRTESTHVATTAEEAWVGRAGVCQDMAHLVLGGLRILGIPARYVSGYLHPSSDPVTGETVQGESHAWVEWWDDGWRGFDPTNDQEPLDRWVVVATGRDYLDVRPLDGLFSGGGGSEMFVSVEVTRLD